MQTQSSVSNIFKANFLHCLFLIKYYDFRPVDSRFEKAPETPLHKNVQKRVA